MKDARLSYLRILLWYACVAKEIDCCSSWDYSDYFACLCAFTASGWFLAGLEVHSIWVSFDKLLNGLGVVIQSILASCVTDSLTFVSVAKRCCKSTSVGRVKLALETDRLYDNERIASCGLFLLLRLSRELLNFSSSFALAFHSSRCRPTGFHIFFDFSNCSRGLFCSFNNGSCNSVTSFGFVLGGWSSFVVSPSSN
jgi:hypothetical protein